MVMTAHSPVVVRHGLGLLQQGKRGFGKLQRAHVSFASARGVPRHAWRLPTATLIAVDTLDAPSAQLIHETMKLTRRLTLLGELDYSQTLAQGLRGSCLEQQFLAV